MSHIPLDELADLLKPRPSGEDSLDAETLQDRNIFAGNNPPHDNKNVA